MAMNGNTAGTAVKNALDAMSVSDRASMEKCLQVICTAIFAHLAANAAIATSTPNVTTGSDTKAGTGTIS